MIDMHIHTTNSDGIYNVAQILEMAEQKKLDYISFTDHDRVSAYEELKGIAKNAIFSGKIIPGCELRFVYDKTQFEVLCYGYDYEKFKKSYYVSVDAYINIKKGILKNCLEKGKLLGFVYNNIEFHPETKPEKDFYMEIIKHEENLPILKKYDIKHSGEFFRKLIANRESEMFFDATDYSLSFDEAVDFVHECGGIAVLAHPFGVYKIDNPKKLLDELLAKNKLDGLECCHADITPEQSKYLLEICKKYNLVSTGGSDFHGYPGQVFAKWDKGTKDIETKLLDSFLDKIDKNTIIE